jgi:hypothetical protein
LVAATLLAAGALFGWFVAAVFDKTWRLPDIEMTS